jgi:hypothetical protein
MIGLSGDAFGNLLVVSGATGVAIGLVVMAIAKRKGVDISSRKFLLTLALLTVAVFGGIPLWFTDLSVLTKTIATGLALIVVTGNYFFIDKMQRILKVGKRKEECHK